MNCFQFWGWKMAALFLVVSPGVSQGTSLRLATRLWPETTGEECRNSPGFYSPHLRNDGGELTRGFGRRQNTEQPTISAKWLLSLRTRPANAVVWHLSHSGYAVKTAGHFLIFDYVPGNTAESGGVGGLMAGKIDPVEIIKENVIVFISHEHGDHFFPDCLQWKDTVDRIHFVVSSDVAQKDGRFSEMKERTTVMDPGREMEIDGLVVKTVLSTDLGVGFFVKTDGLSIWHAGDTAAWGGKVAGFLGNLDPIKGESIDIAFQVGEAGFWDFAEAMKPKLIVPMHFFGRYKMADILQAEHAERKSNVQYWKVEKPGDWILFKAGKMIRPQDLEGGR